MGSLSVGHWAIVLVIVMLVFGTKKLANMGTDLGTAVKGFREGVKGNGALPEQKPVQQLDDHSATELVKKEKTEASIGNA